MENKKRILAYSEIADKRRDLLRDTHNLRVNLANTYICENLNIFEKIPSLNSSYNNSLSDKESFAIRTLDLDDRFALAYALNANKQKLFSCNSDPLVVPDFMWVNKYVRTCNTCRLVKENIEKINLAECYIRYNDKDFILYVKDRVINDVVNSIALKLNDSLDLRNSNSFLLKSYVKNQNQRKEFNDLCKSSNLENYCFEI